MVSFLLPKRLHQDFYNVYSFCRWADDLGDEIGDTAESLRLLKWWRAELHRMYAGEASHPVFVALQGTVAARELPIESFDDLITAFERDQTTTRYRNFEEVFEYCRYSANPVGRLVLGLCGYRDPAMQSLSDATCTALQLANFWQDVTVDWEKNRVYLPLDLLERHGYPVEGSRPALRRTLPDGHEGRGRRGSRALLGRTAPGRHGRPPSLHRPGAVQPRWPQVLEKIERMDYNVLAARPSISKVERVALLLGALRRRAFSRAA